MDTSTLEAAYRRLLEVVRGGGFRQPADAQDWPAELQLGHVIATDRLLAATTAEVLAGAAHPRYDNLVSTRDDYLADIGRAAGDWDGLVASVRQCGLELVLLARRLTEREAATPVAVCIRDREEVRVEAALPWSGVLLTHAEVDLAERTRALEALR